jgi:hypothetical protein
MGISKNGPNGPVTGRVGNLVYYMLNGQPVVRSIGKITKAASVPQLSARKITRISSKRLKMFKAFLKVGFSIEITGTTQNAFNMAVSVNKRAMMTGVYPNFQVDYSKLVLSRGILKPGEELNVSATDEAIFFTWKAEEKMAWPESTDLVMMLAYFPELDRTIVKISGNARNTGADQMPIPPSLKDAHSETYIAFVAADRLQVSDSTYLGSLNLPIQ